MIHGFVFVARCLGEMHDAFKETMLMLTVPCGERAEASQNGQVPKSPTKSHDLEKITHGRFPKSRMFLAFLRPSYELLIAAGEVRS